MASRDLFSIVTGFTLCLVFVGCREKNRDEVEIREEGSAAVPAVLPVDELIRLDAVSYTHLTLPTNAHG